MLKSLVLVWVLLGNPAAAGEPETAAQAADSIERSQPTELPTKTVLNIEGMTCSNCEKTVKTTLLAVPGVSHAVASHIERAACVTLTPSTSADTVAATINAIEGYQVTGLQTVTRCPPELRPGYKRIIWGQMEGIDAKVISTGEQVSIKSHLVAGKFTLIDFGATWCSPCIVAAKQFQAYMKQHPDVAARAIDLEGHNPAESFAQPVAKQHLSAVPGLPWFLLYSPKGKKLYQGSNPDAVLKLIEKKREP